MERRQIVLPEFGKIELPLNSEEARELAACSFATLQIRLLEDGRYELRAGSRIGTVVLPTLYVSIRPKIKIPDLFQLLVRFYGRSFRWGDEGFRFDGHENLLAWLVRCFDHEMERARDYGLPLDYVETQETLATVRGRIDIVEQLNRRQLRPYPIECRYDEYTDDIPLNRILREAHSVALGVPEIGMEQAMRLESRYQRLFSSVQSTDGLDIHDEVHFTHLTRHWERAYELAKLLLQCLPIRDGEGKLLGTSFTVPLDRVFEHFVQAQIKARLAQSGLSVSSQKRFWLTPFAELVDSGHVCTGIWMKPDLVVERGGKTLAVADIKYKKTDDIGSFHQPDVYQLFTYCAALGVKRGLLIYADSQPHITQRISLPAYDGYVDIDTISIDLSLPWRGILQKVDEVVRELHAIASE